MERQIIKGIVFSVTGTALFAPIFAAGKFADGMVPALVIVAMRYVGGFATVLAAVLISRTPFSTLRSARPSQHIARAGLGAAGGACTIQAASLMPIADATAIGLTEGLLVVLLAAFLLREKVTRLHWIAGLLCAGGAYLIVSASTEAGGVNGMPASGVIFAFAGAVFIALEILMIKILARREKALGVLLYVNAIGSVVAIVLAVAMHGAASMQEPGILVFLVLGPIAIIAQYCNITALRHIDASVAGPLSYSWILFSALIGVVFFDEIPGAITILGAALIVGGGLCLTRLKATTQVIPDGRRRSEMC